MTTATGATIDYSYDGIKRLDGTTVKPEGASTALYTTAYAYKTRIDGKDTTLVEFRNVKDSSGSIIDGYKYTYDDVGNIIQISEPLSPYNPLVKYVYDSQNQLLSETYYDGEGDTDSNITDIYTCTYDTAGNILTESKNGTITANYTYDNAEWLDLLTSYRSGLIAYEGQEYQPGNGLLADTTGTVSGTPMSGNPVSYYNGTRWTMEWEQGRALAESVATRTNSVIVNEDKVDTETKLTYEYDAAGMRTSRTVTTTVYKYSPSSGEGVASVGANASVPNLEPYVRYIYSTTAATHNYVTQNGKVVRETIGSGRTGKVLDFIYDESGRPFALKYSNNGGTSFVTYYYVLNLQGDVVGLLNRTGTLIAKYTYNAWGEVLSVTNASGTAITSSTHIANLNPLRYRGYYFDSETGFYYLQSRYYDPVTHRFINADSLASTGQGILGTNMFAYCRNNPVDRVDASGMADEDADEVENKDGNVENMMAFFGVSSPEDLPELDEGCMVFLETVTSITLGSVTIVMGRTIVMDRDKYCEYTFTGISKGYGVLPVDVCTTGGYVYNVYDPSDYAGIFFGVSANLVADGGGGAIAPNGVKAEILGTYGYLSVAAGGSVTYYTASSESWIYGKANISWHANNYRSVFDLTPDTKI